MQQQRRRFKQASPLDQRLTEQAERLRKEARVPRQESDASGYFDKPGSLKQLRTFRNGFPHPACGLQGEQGCPTKTSE